jgi:hypothetical protein
MSKSTIKKPMRTPTITRHFSAGSSPTIPVAHLEDQPSADDQQKNQRLAKDLSNNSNARRKLDQHFGATVTDNNLNGEALDDDQQEALALKEAQADSSNFDIVEPRD